MNIAARPARSDDLAELTRLYRLLATEMSEYHRMWNLADGLHEPLAEELAVALGDPLTTVYVGMIDEVPFGFIMARSEPLLSQAEGERIGVIRLVFTEPEAREVPVPERGPAVLGRIVPAPTAEDADRRALIHPR